MLVGSMLVFGAASIAASFSGGVPTLTWFRFVTGLGLGGAMPTSITLASEYSPAPRRASLVTLMFCGFTIGSALGGLIAAQVLERYGWRPLLVGGGVFPLALAPLLWRTLPESVRYLVQAGRPASQIASVLSQIAPGTDFAGLWGGSTLPAWRGRGIYRALVARRAQLAVGHGYRFLQVDASDDSRPILERLGFVAVTTTTPYVWTPPPP